MDWIYRNVPGAVVKRRTHQILEVPPFPNQEVFQTLIGLNVEEREGGYGDRTGMKNQRYIEMLEKDLDENPGDTRTLYYLGYAHFDIFNQNSKNPNATHWEHLEKGVNYFKIRAHTTGGNSEELWFALLKVSRSLRGLESMVPYSNPRADANALTVAPALGYCLLQL